VERPTLDALASGVGGELPLVIGGLDDEFTMIADDLPSLVHAVPAPVLFGVLGLGRARRRAYLSANRVIATEDTRRLVGRYISDMTMRRDVIRAAWARGEALAPKPGHAPTWVYAFSWRSPTKHWAMHCLDVPFFFDRLGAEGVARIAGDRPPTELAGAYHGAAVEFVSTGDVAWMPWSSGGGPRVFTDPEPSPEGAADPDPSITQGNARVSARSGPYAGLLPLL
ncbi:MAG: hypothetical protein ACTH31_08280, partial [Pseudoclavibacter sp.]